MLVLNNKLMISRDPYNLNPVLNTQRTLGRKFCKISHHIIGAGQIIAAKLAKEQVGVLAQ